MKLMKDRYLEVDPRRFCLLFRVHIPIGITGKALCCLDHYVYHGTNFFKALRQLNPEWKAWVQDHSMYAIGGDVHILVSLD